MGDARAPFELTLRFGVDAGSYDEARVIGQRIAEATEHTFPDAPDKYVRLVDLRVERRGAMRP